MHVRGLPNKTKNEIKTVLFLCSRQRRTTEQITLKHYETIFIAYSVKISKKKRIKRKEIRMSLYLPSQGEELLALLHRRSYSRRAISDGVPPTAVGHMIVSLATAGQALIPAGA